MESMWLPPSGGLAMDWKLTDVAASEALKFVTDSLGFSHVDR